MSSEKSDPVNESGPNQSSANEPIVQESNANGPTPNPFLPQPNMDGVEDSEIEIIDAPPNSDAAECLGRLHYLSLVFDIMSHVRTFVIPAIIALLSAASGNVQGFIIAGVLFVPTLATSAIRYFSLRYRIQEADLIVTQGLFFQRNRTVPIEKIQNIDLIQNILHRIFNVAEVRIETASGTEPEATLRVLAMDQVDSLRSAIFRRANENNSISSESAGTESELSGVAEPILSIPTTLLLKAGLASNKGTLLLGVLAGIYFQFQDQVQSFFDLETFVETFQKQHSTSSLVYWSVGAILAIMIFFRLLGIAWFVLRFFNYQLIRNGEDLRIQCGLLTKVSATVPRKRIQFISIHRNLLLRWMGLASLRIETAGGAGKGGEDAAKSVSSRWFVPVLPESEVKRIVEALRPGLQWNEDGFDWQPISAQAPKRLSRIAIVAAIVVANIGFFLSRPWGALVGIVALPLFILIATKKSQAKRYARGKDIVIFRSGIFTKKTSLTFFEKIQTVYVATSPFDRRWKMATLCIDTAASGPADHKIHIKYLNEEFAQSEFDKIVKNASGHVPVFG